MTDDMVNKPHDRFVRWFLGKLDNARKFIEMSLPQEVLRDLDLTTLQATQQTFINETLREGLSDLCFTVQLSSPIPTFLNQELKATSRDFTNASGKYEEPIISNIPPSDEALVVLLFEHKSSQDRFTVFQILKYMVRIWEKQQQDKQKFSAIIPVVLYNGVEKWTAATEMSDLLNVPVSLQAFVPQFQLSLIDLSEYDDEQLHEDSVFLMTFWLLKYIRRDGLKKHIRDVLRLHGQLNYSTTGFESLEAVLRYIVSATNQIERTEIQKIIYQEFPKHGDRLMATIAEEWVKEGREEGIEIGMEKGMEK